MNCVYCYERVKKDFSLDVDKAASIVKEMLHTKTALGTKIKLHGGEPFLEFETIRRFCEHVWEEEYPEVYDFHITTNGTLIHGYIQEWLAAHHDKITLKLSLDGNRHSNEINRPHSFDRIDIPFFLKYWPAIQVNMTVTPMTIPYFAENIKYLHSVGFLNINVNFALLVDWSQCKLERVFHDQLMDVIGFYLANPRIVPANLFQIDIGRTLEGNVFYAPCNIGQKTAYDFETGQYYPCHMFFPSVCGKEYGNRLQEVDFTKKDGLVSGACFECPFINICRTCYAENYMVRGSLALRDMALCPYQKQVFVALFKYEYARILKLDQPTSVDFRKMEAIQKWQRVIHSIEEGIVNA